MTVTGSHQSKNILQEYIDILRDCSESGKLPESPIEPSLLGRIHELKSEGLLNFGDDPEPHYGCTEPCTVTPKGGIALVEWERVIREKSFWYKFIINISRLLWVLVGAFAASLSDLIDLIKCI